MRAVGLAQRIIRFVKRKQVTTVAEIVAEVAPKGFLVREVRGMVTSLLAHEKLVRCRTEIMPPPKLRTVSLAELGRRIDRAIVKLGYLPKATARQQLEGYGKTPKELY